MRSLFRKPLSLRRNVEGSAVIEFALITPLLFLLLAGIMEISMVMFTYSVLEGATNVGSRIGKTGFSSGGMTREQYILSEIQRLSYGLLDPTKIDLSIRSYDNFDNVGKPEPCISPPTGCSGTAGVNFVDVNGNGVWDQDMGRTNSGGTGAVVVYRVTYPWKLSIPMIGHMMGATAGNTINITAVATVRNEPVFGTN